MTTDEEQTPEPVQLPMAPNIVRGAAQAELDRLDSFIPHLKKEDWAKPSAVSGWTVGDVVTHLNLGLLLYGPILSAAVSGKGPGGMWEKVGEITKAVAPTASPALNAINSAIPRLVDRTLSQDFIKGQLLSSSRSFRSKLDRIDSHDYGRIIPYMGPWPLPFFLSYVVDELAIHRWDMASPLDSTAHLGEEARSVLPWYYWAGTPFMLRIPRQITGTVQASLDSPAVRMWWAMTSEGTKQGIGEAESPDVAITGESGTFILALAGRIVPDRALRTTSLTATGDATLARAFLDSWKIL